MFSLSTWREKNKWTPPSGVVDSWPAGIDKDSPWFWQRRTLWALATQDRACLICRENTLRMSAPARGMVISPGRQPVGTAESKGLKIYLWEAITGIKSGRERRGAFEMQRKDDCHPLQFAPSTYNIDFIYVSIIWLDGWVIIICRGATRELIVDGRQQHKGSKT